MNADASTSKFRQLRQFSTCINDLDFFVFYIAEAMHHTLARRRMLAQRGDLPKRKQRYAIDKRLTKLS